MALCAANLLADVTISYKRRRERRKRKSEKEWHPGGGCGLPEAGEKRYYSLHPQAQLDVPSCLPQIPKEKKVEKIY